MTRRKVWDLIREIKNERGKCVILTTQHLDEADYLADRIAILSHGSLICLGTPHDVKKKFGVGYHLIIEQK